MDSNSDSAAGGASPSASAGTGNENPDVFDAVCEEDNEDQALAEIEKYVAQGGDVNACDPSDQFERSLLHYAAENNYVKVIERLAQLGAYMDVKDRWLRTPLHLAAESPCKDCGDAMKALVHAGACIGMVDETGEGFLAKGSFFFSPSTLEWVLTLPGILDGWSPGAFDRCTYPNGIAICDAIRKRVAAAAKK